MIDKEKWKEIDENSNKVNGIVSSSLFAIIMIFGYFIPFYIFASDAPTVISSEWKFYFIFIIFVSIFSLIWPGMKLTRYFFKKYYLDK